MGLLFVAILFIILFIIGIIGLAIGIVGIMIIHKKKKNGSKIPKFLNILFITFSSLGSLFILIPLSFTTIFILMNTLPPEDYVETDIIIEENGYQATKFTANNVVYEVLEFELYDSSILTKPIFSYKTQGFLNGSQCGNYYEIENSQNFNIVSSKTGVLFAPTEEIDKIYDYYKNPNNLDAYYDCFAPELIKLSSNQKNLLNDYINMDKTNFAKQEIILDNTNELVINITCNEKIVFIESYWFIVINNQIFYVEYSEFTDDGNIKYNLIDVPSSLETELLELYQE